MGVPVYSPPGGETAGCPAVFPWLSAINNARSSLPGSLREAVGLAGCHSAPTPLGTIDRAEWRADGGQGKPLERRAPPFSASAAQGLDHLAEFGVALGSQIQPIALLEVTAPASDREVVERIVATVGARYDVLEARRRQWPAREVEREL